MILHKFIVTYQNFLWKYLLDPQTIAMNSLSPKFALDGIFNKILRVKTNKFMGEGEFNNLMGERILKKTLLVGESLPKISSWASNFLSSRELMTRLQLGRAKSLRDHLQMFDQVLIEFDRKYLVKIN